jgi:ferritin
LPTEVKQLQMRRLVDFFGETGAKIIIEHIDDLEKTFGSASQIILMIIDGRLPRRPNHFEEK